MSKSKSKVRKGKKVRTTGVRYTKSQKKEIVSFVKKNGREAAMKKFNVSSSSLVRWKKGA